MHYAELFCQSCFSFLQGASHPQELVSQADFLGYKAIAITDECSVAGVVRAYTEIKEHNLNIKLIIGSLFCLAPDLKLILLCPNHQAYAELCRIITNARRRSPKGEYELNQWDLKTAKHCLAVFLPQNTERDESWLEWLKKYYSGRLWIGCQRHLHADEQHYLQHCEYLSSKFSVAIIACGGVLMHTPERLPLQHVLSAIREGKPVSEMGKHLLINAEQALRPPAKLQSLYPQEWLFETLNIAQRCHFNLSEIRSIYAYPAELIPKGKTPSEHLRNLVLKGMGKRFSSRPKNYNHIKRTIVKELRLIKEMEYEYFFLTIHDIVQFAQQQRILYQGRGSAANSIVCYCLEITSVDPAQIDVLFERFISKERAEPPDIDVDFEHERREEIIQYIYRKYGRERTALAATVITYRFKSALRETGKVLGINESQLDFFIKNTNRRDREVGWEAQLKDLGLRSDEDTGQQLTTLVKEIVGFPRHLSQHVGGFVIASGPLYEVVPVENASMPDRTVIQWDKDDLESLGLLKVDVLALGMLTAIRKSFQLIEQYYGRLLSIADITAMPPDPGVYQMIQKADTVGVFQIESRAQMSMLPRLKPRCYYDLVIQIAIVRPGPIQGDMVHPFLKRRNGLEKEEYPSEAVKSVLSRTMGVPIFQEQVIKLAMVAAGFSGGEADQLRRAMASWKKTGELNQFKTKLIRGMLERGYKQEFAERLFKQICGFGEYGFPESHSASFAVLAYVSSWLKYHYPIAFYTGLLNSWPMGFYPPSQIVQDAKRHGMTVLPVCVNSSVYDHTIEIRNSKKGRHRFAIRLGIRQVKGITQSNAELLIAYRPKQGFNSTQQIKRLNIPKDDLEALASANAMHALSNNRYATRWELMNNEPNLPLFNIQNESIEVDYKCHEPSAIDNLLEDYNSTRLSLDYHPIQILDSRHLLGKYTPASKLHLINNKSIVSVAGVVIGRQSPGTASGVTFMTIEDHSGNVNIVVWLATARAQRQVFLKAKIIRITGILERGDGDVMHVIAGKLQDLTHLLQTLNTKSRDFH